MGKQTFIEINGKKYDAVTGGIISEAVRTKPAVQTVRITPNQGAIDGFSRRAIRPNRVAAHHASKTPQKSKTLMRHAVQKPTPVAKKITKPQHTIAKSSLGQKPSRLSEAKNSHRSPQIQKFTAHAPRTSVAKRTAELPVKHQPTQTTTTHTNHLPTTQPAKTHQPNQIQQTASQKHIESALAAAYAHTPEHHAHQKHLETQRQAHHNHHKKTKKGFMALLGISSRTARVSSAVLAIALFVGFFSIQNVPNLAMRVAATRAGFDASMPTYKPAGFSFNGPIDYSPGQVTISFKSNTDDRYYDVKQQASDWNSETLLSNFISAESKTHQTYVDRGRILFIYDGSNATWVDGGVWYTIEGQSDMTTDQLVRIASSI